MKKTDTILYDVTRLINRRRSNIPTGIDRIDLRFACAAFEHFGNACIPVVQCGKHTILLEKQRASVFRYLQGLHGAWFAGEDLSPKIVKRMDWLGVTSNMGFGSNLHHKAYRRRLNPVSRMLFDLRCLVHQINRVIRARFHESSPVSNAQNVLYVNVSHQGVARRQGALARLAGDNCELKVLSYIHDLIPIEFPEYTAAGQTGPFRNFLIELMKHETFFLANSEATAGSLHAFVSSYAPNEGFAGNVARPYVIYPGIDPVIPDDTSDVSPAPRNRHPSFVILGTIEPRKNHMMLLQIWRQFAEENADPMPHLHIIGRRGWEIGNIASMIDYCPSIRPHISEHNDLDDKAVRQYLKSCTALLFPSFAEGLGLPLAEAARLNVPVIASDLPAFREIVAGGVEFISPVDAIGWKQAILRACRQEQKLPVPRLKPELGDWKKQISRFIHYIETIQ